MPFASTISGVSVFVGPQLGPMTSRSLITTEGYVWRPAPRGSGAEISMTKNGMRPVHPGEILKEDFLKPAGLSVNALAKALHVPAPRINDIVLERRGITADTAMRLARYFGGDAQ